MDNAIKHRRLTADMMRVANVESQLQAQLAFSHNVAIQKKVMKGLDTL